MYVTYGVVMKQLHVWKPGYNKPTFLLNPNGRHFNRDAVSDGSYVFEDPLEFGNSFKNFDTLIKKVKVIKLLKKDRKS